ncbi:MAG: hypothetical protein IKQ49_00130 [Eubacterium sp.]|nr:hypothetical protein [Eubacterium sp.]
MAKYSDNLRTPSTEEAREIGKKGGIASGEARRRRKKLKEALEVLFATQTSDKLKAAFRKQGVEVPDDLTNEQALAISMMMKAIAGDARMVSLILDVTGEKTVDKLRKKEVELKTKELELREKLMTETKNEALETLDQILQGLHDQAMKEIVENDNDRG